MKHAKLIKKLAKMGVYITQVEWSTDLCGVTNYKIYLTSGVSIKGDANIGDYKKLTSAMSNSANMYNEINIPQ